jgi:hypothetical protein
VFSWKSAPVLKKITASVEKKTDLKSFSNYRRVFLKKCASFEEKISVVTKGTDNEKGGSFFVIAAKTGFSS